MTQLPRSPHGLSGDLGRILGSLRSDARALFSARDVDPFPAQKPLVLDGRERAGGARAARAASRRARAQRLLDEVVHARGGLAVEARAREKRGDPLQARVIALSVSHCNIWGAERMHFSFLWD